MILEAWRSRPLGQMPYLVLDARYEKVRQSGIVQDAAVLIAIGVGLDGKREVIGVSVALSERVQARLRRKRIGGSFCKVWWREGCQAFASSQATPTRD